MRRFANLYIVLFLLDAGLSLLDEILTYYDANLPIITVMRLPVALLVIFLSMAIYACLGVDRRLPKRVLLPMTLYAFWCAVGMWPVSGVVGTDSLALAASFGQVIIAGLAVVLLLGMEGRPLLSERRFQGEMFGLGNTLTFTGVNFVLAPFFLVFMTLAMAGYYLEHQTAGFLRLSPKGVYMVERSYHRGDKEVRLAGMMHIGNEDYFTDLAASMEGKNTIILAEGVTDQDGLLKKGFNYNELAGVIGLTSQDTMQLDANPVDLNAIDASPASHGKPDIARADVDLSQFEDSTVAFLNALGKTLLSERPLAESLVEYNSWVEENMTEEKINTVMHDILDRRNTVIIENFTRALRHYDTIIIPWGAMHMPAIEKAVLSKGFRIDEEQERLSLDFRTIPYASLWQTVLTR